jgi:hypothetical protein
LGFNPHHITYFLRFCPRKPVMTHRSGRVEQYNGIQNGKQKMRIAKAVEFAANAIVDQGVPS